MWTNHDVNVDNENIVVESPNVHNCQGVRRPRFRKEFRSYTDKQTNLLRVSGSFEEMLSKMTALIGHPIKVHKSSYVTDPDKIAFASLVSWLLVVPLLLLNDDQELEEWVTGDSQFKISSSLIFYQLRKYDEHTLNIYSVLYLLRIIFL